MTAARTTTAAQLPARDDAGPRDPTHNPGPWHSRLWRKVAAVLTLLCVGLLAVFGGLDLRATFLDSQAQAGRLQAAQAGEAALALRAAVNAVQNYIEAVNALPWQRSFLGADTRREEFARLLRMVPAAESITYLDAGGHELLNVSRYDTDRTTRVSDLQGLAAQPLPPVPVQGVVLAGHSGQPVFDLVRADSVAGGGHTVVRIGLQALAQGLRQTLSLAGAEVYAVDAGGRLALHRDPLLLLQRPQMEAPLLAQAASARQAASAGAAAASMMAMAAVNDTQPPAVQASNFQGQPVFRTVVPVPELGWSMVVERPRSAVMAPVWAAVGRLALALALAVLLAMLVALWLAGRLTRPVRQLHRAAARMAAGQLDTHITIRTGDELEDLAGQFNEMADSLRANVHELEHRVAARTSELATANNHKRDFLAGMSHEVGTPLNAIVGFADVLDEQMLGPMNADQRECIQDIRQSARHLQALLNDVLDVSRIEAGALTLDPAEFAVAGMVQAAVAQVRQRAEQKGLALQVTLQPDIGTWVADERRIKQVLLNLLTNAIKFTPAGGTVQLRAGLLADGLCLEVQDNGIGIALADQAVVFEQFRQVGDSKSRAQGTGLGLALARSLVQQHGGTLTLDSALGRGALFRVELPAVPTESTPP